MVKGILNCRWKKMSKRTFCHCFRAVPTVKIHWRHVHNSTLTSVSVFMFLLRAQG
eukprot:m.14595 g.14595  ORF g.14595 m.14595 type:complete len:55 (-) comp4804_c0_seq1:18-182(-)